MRNTTNAKDAALNVPDDGPEESKDKNGKNFWKSLFHTVLSITISIFLTFGTNSLIVRIDEAKDRKMTALMVLGNIENFATNLENCAARMGWNDTLAVYLLDIPLDTLDYIDNDSLLYYINNVTAFYSLNHDKSAEGIFSNTIDTWRNLGNFEFIENVGQSFADINSIEEIYNDFFNTTNRIRERMLKNIGDCEGKTMASKILHDYEYRSHLKEIHSQSEYYHYLAAHIRWKNAKSMELMNIREAELKKFIEKSAKKQENKTPTPKQNSFRTPPLNIDDLPDFKDWINI